MVEPCLLAREMEVALDIEAVSFMLVVVGEEREGQGRRTGSLLTAPTRGRGESGHA